MTTKTTMIVLTALALAVPFTAHAGDKTAQARENTAITGSQSAQGPKNSYEVAALFTVLEKKGVVNKEELAKEVHNLDPKPFTDPNPWLPIR